MAEQILALTRMGTDGARSPVLVNLENVAWMERDEAGGTRIVFAAGAQGEGGSGVPLTLVVGESLQEIASLSRVVQTSDNEAIAQAWADQTARRQPEPDAT
jgi:hypothetical protein